MQAKDSGGVDQGQAIIEVEGKILQRAKVKALGLVQQSPTAENLKSYQAAEKALAEFERRQLEAEKPEEMVFATVAEAYRYAIANGYAATRKTMDNHIKAGRLIASRTGTIRRLDLERYLNLELGVAGDDGNDLQQEKIRAEVKKIKAQAEHWRTRSRREKGELIEVVEVERALAERAAFLRADLENFFRSQAAAIIDRVSGDHELFQSTPPHGGRRHVPVVFSK